MKTKILFIVFVFWHLVSNCQSISFKYDENGNLISKSLIYFNDMKDAADSSFYSSLELSIYAKDSLSTFPNVKISPNPSEGHFSILYQGTGSIKGLYYIYSLSGKLLFHGKIDNSDVDVDISMFEDGVYILVIDFYNIRQQVKVIKI